VTKIGEKDDWSVMSSRRQKVIQPGDRGHNEQREILQHGGFGYDYDQQ